MPRVAVDQGVGLELPGLQRRSGATGIPQSLPGSKMASAGADWQSNATTQIRWGLGYITERVRHPVQRVGPLAGDQLVLSRASTAQGPEGR